MSKGLTARQREVMEAIREFQARKGYPPSIRELGKILESKPCVGWYPPREKSDDPRGGPGILGSTIR